MRFGIWALLISVLYQTPSYACDACLAPEGTEVYGIPSGQCYYLSESSVLRGYYLFSLYQEVKLGLHTKV